MPRWDFPRNSAYPYYPAFVRNHYIGRTFIQPTQRIRDFNVRVKLNLILEAVQGQARGRGGRLHCARHHRALPRGHPPRGRSEGSAHAHQLSAAQIRVLLRHRLSRSREASRQPVHAWTKSADISAPIPLATSISKGMIGATGRRPKRILHRMFQRRLSGPLRRSFRQIDHGKASWPRPAARERGTSSLMKTNKTNAYARPAWTSSLATLSSAESSQSSARPTARRCSARSADSAGSSGPTLRA